MAARYHLLPSQIISQATTVDLVAFDTYNRWHRRQTAIANGTYKPEARQLSQEEMLAMIKQANQKKKQRAKK